MSDFIQARLDSISVTNVGFILFLKGDDPTRVLPVFIGANEAQSIALALGDEPPPRPQTHDLQKAMLDALEVRVDRVEITDLRDGTFYAVIRAVRDGIEDLEFDSRPSDAIALAVRYDAPIFVARAVFEQAGVPVPTDDADETDGTAGPDMSGSDDASGTGDPESGAAPAKDVSAKPVDMKPLTPADALRKALDRAVRDERYEEAARLRDELKRLGAGN